MPETKQERFNRIINDPETVTNICAHIANGGSLIDLCNMWSVSYAEIISWLNRDDDRRRSYTDALKANTEWAVSRILAELRSIAFADLRKIFNPNGGLLPPDQWPDDIARTIAGLEVIENFDGQGDQRKQSGWTKRVKFTDKLKSIEMMMKNLNMLTDRVEVSGKVTLEDLVIGSQKKTE